MSCPFTGDASDPNAVANRDSGSTTPGSTTGKKGAPTIRGKGPSADPAHRADEGFFGPGSVAWKVWSYPTPALQGFFRAVTIEHLDPDLVAAADDSGQVCKRTPIGYDRTMEFFAAVFFADAQAVTRMSDILMKVHDRSYGKNPVTGNDYDANRSSSQLWILVTAWHSMLYCYEKFGPGKLSRDEENEYWAQMAISASFQPIRQEDLPTTRGEVQKFFDDWREKLSASEAAIRKTDHILDGFRTIEPDLPKWLITLGRPFLRGSIIATYPRWMRPMLGVKQSHLADSLSIAFWRPIYKVLDNNPKLFLWLLERICPRAVRYMEPLLLKTPAKTPRVYTPAVARRMFGNPLTPLEQREELLKKRQEGVGQASYGHNHHDEILEFANADDVEAAAKVLDAIEEIDLNKVG
ncbi:oxygenase MpaB family protein [Corynebacterium variabile]|uniref:oxygenase MpaB family protein n=1 Tax=Corynebacterium variabile TaxID=1727 RepID=UPI003F8F163D